MTIDNKKLVTWGVILVGGYLVYRFVIKGSIANASSTSDGGGGGVISASQINKMANDIFNAMDGYGTDEDTILVIFQKVKTDSDFDALVRAFGSRTISSGSGNIFVSDFTGDLSSCLRDELSPSWIDDINAALQRNGVSRSI
jgi:hypothetical protein